MFLTCVISNYFSSSLIRFFEFKYSKIRSRRNSHTRRQWAYHAWEEWLSGWPALACSCQARYLQFWYRKNRLWKIWYFTDRYQVLNVQKSVPFHLIANFYPAGDQTRSPGLTNDGKLQYHQLDQSFRRFNGAREQNQIYNQDFPSFNDKSKTNSKTKKT